MANKKKQHQKRTWFVYDANGPLFSWSPTGDIKDNFARAEEYLRTHHPDVYQKAVVEGKPEYYEEMVRKNQEGSLSGELPVYPNRRMLKIAHKIKRHGGRNVVISDGEKRFLKKLIHKISDENPPFEDEDIKSSMYVGKKKDPRTWYSIFQEMGVHKGDRFYGVEDTDANAHAMAEAAEKSGLAAKVYLIDKGLPENEARKDGNIIRIGGEEYLEKRIKRHIDYLSRKKSKRGHTFLGLFIVSFAILEFL